MKTAREHYLKMIDSWPRGEKLSIESMVKGAMEEVKSEILNMATVLSSRKRGIKTLMKKIEELEID